MIEILTSRLLLITLFCATQSEIKIIITALCTLYTVPATVLFQLCGKTQYLEVTVFINGFK